MRRWKYLETIGKRLQHDVFVRWPTPKLCEGVLAAVGRGAVSSIAKLIQYRSVGRSFVDGS